VVGVERCTVDFFRGQYAFFNSGKDGATQDGGLIPVSSRSAYRNSSLYRLSITHRRSVLPDVVVSLWSIQVLVLTRTFCEGEPPYLGQLRSEHVKQILQSDPTARMSLVQIAVDLS
jgi:hypothetical protein